MVQSAIWGDKGSIETKISSVLHTYIKRLLLICTNPAFFSRCCLTSPQLKQPLVQLIISVSSLVFYWSSSLRYSMNVRLQDRPWKWNQKNTSTWERSGCEVFNAVFKVPFIISAVANSTCRSAICNTINREVMSACMENSAVAQTRNDCELNAQGNSWKVLQLFSKESLQRYLPSWSLHPYLPTFPVSGNANKETCYCSQFQNSSNPKYGQQSFQQNPIYGWWGFHTSLKNN